MKQKLIVLLMFLFATIIYGQKGSYEVTASELNIREQADKNSNAIGKFSRKQIVEVESIEGDWAKIFFIDENGIEKTGYISNKYITPIENIKSSKPKNKTFLYTISIIGLISLVCYIVALVKTRNGEMTTIVNEYDFYLLCATSGFPLLGYLFGKTDFGKDIGLYLGGLCFIGSAIWSIIANKDNYFHALLSVIAKIFIGGIALTIVVLSFINGPKTTKRVQRADGSYYNKPLNMYEQRKADEAYMSRKSLSGFLLYDLIGQHLIID